MSNDINFTIDKKRFNFRVALMLECGDKILMQNREKRDFWTLPGGRVKLFERTETAIKREAFEELDIRLNNAKLIDISENFFVWRGNKMHELLFTYKAKISKNNNLAKKQDFLTKDDPDEINHWYLKSEIKQLKCFPISIKELIDKKTDTFSYHNENRK